MQTKTDEALSVNRAQVLRAKSERGSIGENERRLTEQDAVYDDLAQNKRTLLQRLPDWCGVLELVVSQPSDIGTVSPHHEDLAPLGHVRLID
jgi:hypothetical protein